MLTRFESSTFAAQIVGFCRYTRTCGFAAGVPETLASLEAVCAAQPSDLVELKDLLRPVICSSKDEWQKFAGLFQDYWESRPGMEKPETPKAQRKRPPIVGGISAAGLLALAGPGGSSPESAEDCKTVSGASIQARLRKVDFSQVPLEQQDLLDALAKRLFMRAVWRLSRRLKAGRTKLQVDLRRTMRASIGRGGDLVELRYKARTPKPPPVVMLLDVSGSMSLYSFFLLRFVHAMQKHFKRADTFIFSTSLADVRSSLRSRDLPESFRALSEKAAGWSAGTKIGQSLREFNQLHSRLLSRDTLLLILSDGWDTGDPEQLSEELCAIKSRVRSIIWLNPLLGMEQYSPDTRGMRAALPFINVFAPAHSLQSLLDLEKYFAGWSGDRKWGKHLCSTN